MVTKCLRRIRSFCLCLAVIYALQASVASAQSADPTEEQAVRDVVAPFYEGWNEHDVDNPPSEREEDVFMGSGAVAALLVESSLCADSVLQTCD